MVNNYKIQVMFWKYDFYCSGNKGDLYSILPRFKFIYSFLAGNVRLCSDAWKGHKHFMITSQIMIILVIIYYYMFWNKNNHNFETTFPDTTIKIIFFFST